MKSRVRGAASKPLQTSRSTPQSRVVTPMEALSFGEKAAEVNVALSLARRQLGEYEFYAKNHALLGTGSYGSVRASAAVELVRSVVLILPAFLFPPPRCAALRRRRCSWRARVTRAPTWPSSFSAGANMNP